MLTTEGFSVHRTFLLLLIVSVSLSAVVGIAALLAGSFGAAELRIVGSTVTIAVASVCGLACAARLDTPGGRALSFAGIALSPLAAVLVIVWMWLEVRSPGYAKLTLSTCVWAVACAHLVLLSNVRIDERFQWSMLAARWVIPCVAGLITLLIVFEGQNDDSFRLLGVGTILDAVVTVLIVVFHRMSPASAAPAAPRASRSGPEAIDGEIAALKARTLELERLRRRQVGAK